MRQLTKISFIGLVLLALDIIVKIIIENKVKLGEIITIFPFFKITKFYNNGVAFSFLKNNYSLIITIVVIAVLFLGFYIYKALEQKDNTTALLLVIVLVGAIGNFIDRLIYGHVIDYFQVEFGNYIFPIFNLADVYISVGVGLLILKTLIDERKSKNG